MPPGVTRKANLTTIEIVRYFWDCPDCDKPKESDYQPVDNDDLLCSTCWDKQLAKKLRDEHRHLEGATIEKIKPYYDGNEIYEMIDYIVVRGNDGKRYKLVCEDNVILSVPVASDELEEN